MIFIKMMLIDLLIMMSIVFQRDTLRGSLILSLNMLISLKIVEFSFILTVKLAVHQTMLTIQLQLVNGFRIHHSVVSSMPSFQNKLS